MIDRLRELFTEVYRRIYWGKLGNEFFAAMALWVLALAVVAPLIAIAVALHQVLPPAYRVISLIAFGLVFIAGWGLAVIMEEAGARARVKDDRTTDNRINKRDLKKASLRLKSHYAFVRDRLARLALFVDRWTGGTPDSRISHRGNPAMLLTFALIVCLPVALLYVLLPHSYRIFSIFPVAPAVLMGSDVIWTANRMREQREETGRFPWCRPKVVNPPAIPHQDPDA